MYDEDKYFSPANITGADINFTAKAGGFSYLELSDEKCPEERWHNAANDGDETNEMLQMKEEVLAVSVIIERLCVHGSIAAVIKFYGDTSEEQIKDALAYAAGFLQIACQTSEVSEEK